MEVYSCQHVIISTKFISWTFSIFFCAFFQSRIGYGKDDDDDDDDNDDDDDDESCKQR